MWEDLSEAYPFPYIIFPFSQTSSTASSSTPECFNPTQLARASNVYNGNIGFCTIHNASTTNTNKLCYKASGINKAFLIFAQQQ